MELAYNSQGANIKTNSFHAIEDPYMIIQVIKKICSKNIRNEKEFLSINVYKKDLIAYIRSRYKNIGFCKKIIQFFFPNGTPENAKMRYLDYYHLVNVMLNWSKMDQLGFCFHLLDTNNDGFICIKDLFELMG